MQNRPFQPKTRSFALRAIALSSLLYALYIAVHYAWQLPLDQYKFRQAQTALTAYWLRQNGFSLAYETPVAGPPWSIPFEFPLYQYLVALTSQVSGISLDACGRLVSFLFLVLCLIPARAITRNLRLSDSTFPIFTVLLMSSPLYLYWGRTFMIETAALFFSIAGIKYFVDLLHGRRTGFSTALFILFISLGILQKATTGLPVLAVLSFVYLGVLIREWRAQGNPFPVRKTGLALLLFGIPLLIGIAWTLHTDQVKLHNSLGESLTSGALTAWNWGTLDQRLSATLYGEVIWKRVLLRNLAGILSLALLAAALTVRTARPARLVILVSILLGLLPFFLFTNLHIIHTYYQTGCLIFLIYAVAVALGHVLHSSWFRAPIVAVLVAIMVGSNYYWFVEEQLPVVKIDFNERNSRDYAVGEFLRTHVPEDEYFVAFGNDWSATFAYIAQRKSFTVPPFYKDYPGITRNPEQFIDEAHLGAVVSCPSRRPPRPEELIRWASTHSWRVAEVQNCYIAVRDLPLSANHHSTICAKDAKNRSCNYHFLSPPSQSKDFSNISYTNRCVGNIDSVNGASPSPRTFKADNLLRAYGWLVPAIDTGTFPEKVYLVLTNRDGQRMFIDTKPMARPDVAAGFKNADLAASGYTASADVSTLKGEYVLELAYQDGGSLRICPQFKIPGVIAAEGPR